METPVLERDASARPIQPYRERLLAGMADLCAAAPRAREPQVQTELAAVFGQILDGAEPSVRRRFAEKVAGAVWLSPDFARRLAEEAGPPENEPEPKDAEGRLVRKLQAAGQLKPGFLLRTLREGRLTLFKTGLATLGGFAPSEIDRALTSDRPDLLALAGSVVGLDRSVFPTVLELVRGLNEGAPRGGGGEALEAALLISDPRAAAEAFRTGLATL